MATAVTDQAPAMAMAPDIEVVLDELASAFIDILLNTSRRDIGGIRDPHDSSILDDISPTILVPHDYHIKSNAVSSGVGIGLGLFMALVAERWWISVPLGRGIYSCTLKYFCPPEKSIL